MKQVMLLLVIVLLGVGCSPQRRLARLVERHPEVLRVDTITVRDTVAVPGVSVDTSVFWDGSRDTCHVGRGTWGVERGTWSVKRDSVVIEKGRLEVVVRRVHDTLFIRGKCKADTVFIRRKIPVTRIVVAESKRCWWLYGVVALLIVMVFVMLFRR